MGELAYIGKILKVEDIPGADRIKLCTAVCGKGGIWKGVVPIESAIADNLVVVFQPDSLLPKDNLAFAFMERYKYRVKQRQFKGMPSESLIMPFNEVLPPSEYSIGQDVTELLKVEKYEKPGFKGDWQTEGFFPPFLRKTDEPNFQKVPEMVSRMREMNVIVTLKMDGMSSTAWKKESIFGVCSRHLQVKEGDNPFWKVVKKYKLDETLPEGKAIQWETCGPKIQSNPMGLKEVEGFAFNYWDIETRKYEPVPNLMTKVPFIHIFRQAFRSQPEDWQAYAMQFKYPNGFPAEGIVVRPVVETFGHVDTEYQRFSFKVINLLYKEE